MIEVTARGLPADHWRPLLENAPGFDVPLEEIGSVVVVVPHPDDETLGAGGLLHRLAHRTPRPAVRVVFVTDGAAGYPGTDRAAARRLATLRRGEALAAIAALGLDGTDAVFLELPDGGVTGPTETGLAERLGPVLAEQNADLCLAPWPLDPHPDHQAVGRAAARAAGATGTRLWQYPIWMRHSMPATDPAIEAGRLRVLHLTEAERAAKQAAIETHDSQLRSPFPGYGPVLPDHVLALFDDGLEPFFVPVSG